MPGRRASRAAASRREGRRRWAGRRLAAAVGALGLVGALPVVARAQDRIEGDHYVNPRYGVQIDKPPHWHFITASAVMDAARKAAGLSPLGSDTDAVTAAGFAVIVSKTPVLGREVEPQVVVMIHDLPRAPTDVAGACERLRTGMSDPETVTPTELVRIDGHPAARLDFRGLVDGALVRATALCTFRDRRAFVVVGQALAAEFEGEAPMLDLVLRSFRLQ